MISFPIGRVFMVVIVVSFFLASKFFWLAISWILVIICMNDSSTFKFSSAEVSIKYKASASAKFLPSSSSTSRR
ncbi:hypothetical protein OIU84_008002 [Salix udensis]|uniref:Uncharacterized protein n=1 Tax=Salix udensis TaxID=889485 RepID=A0AAD6JUB6_9ROSI|nr:hypothetical protein OIU84_008002 [Salix udensis]